jgi:hypothetical protein
LANSVIPGVGVGSKVGVHVAVGTAVDVAWGVAGVAGEAAVAFGAGLEPATEVAVGSAAGLETAIALGGRAVGTPPLSVHAVKTRMTPEATRMNRTVAIRLISISRIKAYLIIDRR